MDRNTLADETSPYLLQHKDNPVHWQAWSAAVLAAAKAADKPILLSVGYAACHWCHVMAHECFEDRAIADLMNRLFVSIKVDREERPDLDAIYQHALALLGEQGGWPLTMFLTPDGEPFWGGTYFPPTARWGRPGFPDVLRAIDHAYRNERDKVVQNVGALKSALGRLAAPEAGDLLSIDETQRIAERLVREVDPFNGGIGDAPKFPQTGLFELLWRAYKRTRQEPFLNAVLLTLDHISQGGIYDHLGGGYARYAVDQRWLVPHFEKMLYDNAQLLALLTLVWQDTGRGLYAVRVAETIDWVAREMLTAEGAFASSLDADSEHEEGKFYVWSEAEIDRVLGARAARFKEVYDVTASGNWEGHTILNRLDHRELADPATEAELAACRALLLEARAQRVRPGLDDKVLADWNGLMIAALAEAATVFDRPPWLELARNAFAFITTAMSDSEGRLAHAWRAGRKRHHAVLDDYANMARAALALLEATGDDAYLARARHWVAIADRHYGDAAGGGYFFTADDTEALITRVKTAQDSPNPSGNGVMTGVLARLFYLTGDDAYRARAERVIAAFAGDLRRHGFGYAALINANELLQRAVQIVIRGRRGAPDAEALRRAVTGIGLPNKVLTLVPPEAALPAGHPAFGKGQVEGRATAYVCEGTVCSLPFTEPEALAADLAGRS
ncbi:MAG TPA: thioredoxin domain-containing protein [Stellaceae bacterium]|nr:thioredoxin domain-containing protein [Stellaceae bacterium]